MDSLDVCAYIHQHIYIYLVSASTHCAYVSVEFLDGPLDVVISAPSSNQDHSSLFSC